MVPANSIAEVEVSDDGLYVWFKRGAAATETIVRNRWPLVAIDLDASGEVIGIECAPLPDEFGVKSLARLARVEIPIETAANARFLRAAAAATKSA